MTMPAESIGIAAGLVPSDTLHRGEAIVTKSGPYWKNCLKAFQSPTSRGNDCHAAVGTTIRRASRLSVSCIAGKRLSLDWLTTAICTLLIFQSPTSRGNDCHI